MLPIIVTICLLVAPGVGAATSETSVRARAAEPLALDAPRGEIITEGPFEVPARSLRELMRDRVVLPEGTMAEHPSATVAMSLREMHGSNPGDLGAAIP